MATKFESLAENIVYTEVDSRKDAWDVREDAADEVKKGNTVIIFHSKTKYHIQMPPGVDPYIVRATVEEWMDERSGKKKSSSSSSTSSTSSSSSKSSSSSSSSSKTSSSSSKKSGSKVAVEDLD